MAEFHYEKHHNRLIVKSGILTSEYKWYTYLHCGNNEAVLGLERLLDAIKNNMEIKSHQYSTMGEFIDIDGGRIQITKTELDTKSKNQLISALEEMIEANKPVMPSKCPYVTVQMINTNTEAYINWHFITDGGQTTRSETQKIIYIDGYIHGLTTNAIKWSDARDNMRGLLIDALKKVFPNKFPALTSTNTTDTPIHTIVDVKNIDPYRYRVYLEKSDGTTIFEGCFHLDNLPTFAKALTNPHNNVTDNRLRICYGHGTVSFLVINQPRTSPLYGTIPQECRLVLADMLIRAYKDGIKGHHAYSHVHIVKMDHWCTIHPVEADKEVMLIASDDISDVINALRYWDTPFGPKSITYISSMEHVYMDRCNEMDGSTFSGWIPKTAINNIIKGLTELIDNEHMEKVTITIINNNRYIVNIHKGSHISTSWQVGNNVAAKIAMYALRNTGTVAFIDSITTILYTSENIYVNHHYVCSIPKHLANVVADKLEKAIKN